MPEQAIGREHHQIFGKITGASQQNHGDRKNTERYSSCFLSGQSENSWHEAVVYKQQPLTFLHGARLRKQNLHAILREAFACQQQPHAKLHRGIVCTILPLASPIAEKTATACPPSRHIRNKDAQKSPQAANRYGESTEVPPDGGHWGNQESIISDNRPRHISPAGAPLTAGTASSCPFRGNEPCHIKGYAG